MGSAPSAPRPDDFVSESFPHNLDAERSILGAILLDNAQLETALAHTRVEDFFLVQHRVILKTMIGLARAGGAIDLVLLHEQLKKEAQLEAGGGVGYLAQLADGLPHTTNVEHYAAIVTEKAALRRMIYEAHDIQRRALEPGADLAALQRQLAAASTARAAAPGANGHRVDFPLLDFLEHQFPPPEHLIEGLIPRGGSAMIVAMPHHLKSWFTLALALGASVEGTLMGKLEIRKPVRTYLVTVEDLAADVQWRSKQLLKSATFADWNPKMVQIWPRQASGAIDIMDETCFQLLLRRVQDFQADHVILDVLRRIHRSDINSPKESAALCEQFDRLRLESGAAVTIVHHENRKDADIMRASAGSFNLPAWANVVIQFKRKMTQGAVSQVEIEVDNKLAQSPDPVRMILDLGAEAALRLEAIEDAAGVEELREKLGPHWSVRDLAEVLDVHKANAYRRLKKMITAGIVEKAAAGKRGNVGGLARYCFVQDSSTQE